MIKWLKSLFGIKSKVDPEEQKKRIDKFVKQQTDEVHKAIEENKRIQRDKQT